jgi:phage gp36-like protein
MSYCTQQDLVDRFGEPELIQLTGRDPQGVMDADVIDQAIADADAEIEGYLSAYQLPLTSVPANLTRIACDIARYRLYADQPVEVVMERYKAAVRFLEGVAAGRFILVDAALGGAIDGGEGIEVIAAEPVFGSDADGY